MKPTSWTWEWAVCEAELAYKQAKAANYGQSFQLRYRSCPQKSPTIQLKNDTYRDGTWFLKKVKGMLYVKSFAGLGKLPSLLMITRLS